MAQVEQRVSEMKSQEELKDIKGPKESWYYKDQQKFLKATGVNA